MTIELYHHLNVYGTVFETNHKLINPINFVKWSEEHFEYVRYNPRKDIKRYGLSITSLDGETSGIPDLDSLLEYNRENKTRYTEKDFKVFTPVYEYADFRNIIEPIKDDIFRSHILKLDPAGYFPPHRDYYGMEIDSFRLVIPLHNCNPPNLTFIVDDKIQQWSHGTVYFVDTAKMHYLFNASSQPSYMVVLNVDLTKNAINFVTQNLKYR